MIPGFGYHLLGLCSGHLPRIDPLGIAAQAIGTARVFLFMIAQGLPSCGSFLKAVLRWRCAV
ncbi:hypothetical protein ADL25_41110 [Streptomyces sp. NRRL F-5122]|nr:hypothetical protein ADL25_41110 [Streptomyces sp. NRRL F-5122]